MRTELATQLTTLTHTIPFAIHH